MMRAEKRQEWDWPGYWKGDGCMEGLARLSGLCSRIMYALFIALLAELVIHFALSNEEALGTLALCLVGLTAGVFLLSLAGRVGERMGTGKTLLLLLCLCFAVKLAWVLHVQIKPAGDYQVFWETAQQLAGREVIFGGRYVALFPHLFGYSFFLSLFIKLFGTAPLLAPVINVGLTTLSAALLFDFCRRLLGNRTAMNAALLWILMPSQTIYNMFVLSEPLYTTLILLFLWIVFRFWERVGKARLRRLISLGLCAGVVLAAANAVRPLGPILLIALAIWIFALQLERWREKSWRRQALSFVILLLAAYLAVGQLNTSYLTSRVGGHPAATPGYSILVGFNVESGGQWNQSDSDLLYRINAEVGPWGASQEVQSRVMEQAKARIAALSPKEIASLFYHKLHNLMGSDDSAVFYGADVIAHPRAARLASNAFYYLSMLLAIGGASEAWRRRDRTLLFLPMIFLVGLVCAHMLVEVALRYHYSALITLVILGGHGAELLRQRAPARRAARRI